MSSAAELQEEFRALRAEHAATGLKRGQTLTAYNRWFHQACLEGRPPDALRPDVGDDSERFFARTIPGPDGHTYWFSSYMRFPLNAGGERHARWWWYEHVNGPQGRGRLGSVCGEINCITPEHQQYIPWSEVKRRYTDEQMIGSIQIVASTLGRAPFEREYRAIRRRPGSHIICVRFGSWGKALKAAGLEADPHSLRVPATVDQCIAALRFAAELVGHSPTEDEFRAHNLELRAAGLHSSPSTIYRRIGSWPKALKLAGL